MDILGLTEVLTKHIIRPPRAQYHISDLGSRQFQINNKKYSRTDFNVPITVLVPQPQNKSLRIDLMQASIYQQKYLLEKRPAVIYCHGNSSSRLSARQYINHVLPHFDLIGVDFRGSGLSDGQYVTLGYQEKDDLFQLMRYVEAQYGNKQFILWGRSMGAATALLCAGKYAQSGKIVAVVADSPFNNFQSVMSSIANKRASMVPSFIIQKAILNLQEIVQQKIKEAYGPTLSFQITKLKPQKIIQYINAPIFFVGSKSDELINVSQVVQLYDAVNSYKQLQILEGGHNQVRPQHLKVAIVQFLKASMKKIKKTAPPLLSSVKRRKIFTNVTKKDTKQRSNIISPLKNNRKDKKLEQNSEQKLITVPRIKQINRFKREIIWKGIEQQRKNKQKIYENSISFGKDHHI